MKKGTTLVEVMIYITILAIVVTLAITYYVGQAKKNRDVKKISDLQLFQTAIINYYNEYQHFPIVKDTPKSVSSLNDLLVPKYAKSLPNIVGAVYVNDGSLGSSYALCVELESPSKPALPMWKLDSNNSGGYSAPLGMCTLP